MINFVAKKISTSANIERELLAIVNGCEHFHQYTFRREVFIYPQTSGSYNTEIFLCQVSSEASKVAVAASEVYCKSEMGPGQIGENFGLFVNVTSWSWQCNTEL